MTTDNLHQMSITKVFSTQAEQWECPQCGQQVIVQWRPFRRIPLRFGDQTARHSGTKGGLEIKNVDICEGNFPTDLKDQINDVLNQVD